MGPRGHRPHPYSPLPNGEPSQVGHSPHPFVQAIGVAAPFHRQSDQGGGQAIISSHGQSFQNREVPSMDTSRNPAIEAGKIVLHVGVEAHGWGESDFAEASKFAHSHKVDSLAVKMADGGIRWYRDTSELVAKRKATTE